MVQKEMASIEMYSKSRPDVGLDPDFQEPQMPCKFTWFKLHAKN